MGTSDSPTTGRPPGAGDSGAADPHAALQHTEPARKRSLVRRLLTLWADQQDLHREIVAATILALFPIIGLVGWMLSRSVGDFELQQNVRQQYLVNELNDRRAAMAAFADEIPKNSFILGSLGGMRVWIENPYTNPQWVVAAAQSQPAVASEKVVYRDGRSLLEVQKAYDKQVSDWLIKLHHYSALIQMVKVRFNLDELVAKGDGAGGVALAESHAAGVLPQAEVAGRDVSGEERVVAANLQARLEALDSVLSEINAMGASPETLARLDEAVSRARRLLPPAPPDAAAAEDEAATAGATPAPEASAWGPLAANMDAIDAATDVVDALYVQCLADMQSLLRLSRHALLDGR